MVGRCYSLDMYRAEANTDLRISLYEMKEDVERLQEELDAEREASASSASEAMSVILRLQGEKAMLAMEASQYKRMVEERMSHAEFSLELLEDLNNRREVEIMTLECKLNAYRCKLISLDDDDRSQTPSPELIITDLLVPPVEKAVIEQSLDSSRRHQEKNLDSSKIQDITETEKAKGLCKPDLLVKKMSKISSKQKSDKRDHARGSCSAAYQAELERLKERVERLERERCNTETHTSGLKQENMNLQRKSEEELSCVQSGRKSSKTTDNLLHGDDSAIVAVQEAMLYFWL